MTELKTIRDRLHNWARWSRGGPAKGARSNTALVCDRLRMDAHCEMGSAPGGGDRLDAGDAALIERAWKALQPKHRELLRWHYIREASPGMICRRMGIKPRPTSIFDIELTRAEREIGGALQALAAPAPSFGTSTRVGAHAHVRGGA